MLKEVKEKNGFDPRSFGSTHTSIFLSKMNVNLVAL